LDKLICPKPII